jgi:hypothetical protein
VSPHFVLFRRIYDRSQVIYAWSSAFGWVYYRLQMWTHNKLSNHDVAGLEDDGGHKTIINVQ